MPQTSAVHPSSLTPKRSHHSNAIARTHLWSCVTRHAVKAPLRPTRLRASSGPTPPSTEESSNPLENIDTDKLLKDAQAKWDAVEDKTSLVVYVGGAFLLLFVGSSVVSAFDRLPLFPKLFQLVGLIYTGWFVYRYLLFKSSRKELISDVQDLKDKITGDK